MPKNFGSVLIWSVICTAAWAEPGVHTLRIRFPGPSSDKVVLSQTAKQNIAPYPAAGFKPDPAFELPEPTYLPPLQPELIYGTPEEPELVYGPPAESQLANDPFADINESTELLYGPPDDTYHTPELNEFPSAAIVNAPLTLATQFTPPRPNKANNVRPILHSSNANIINKPNKPVSHLTLPSTKRFVFRPRRPQAQLQPLYPKTPFTLPRVERVIEFRPRRIPHQQQQAHIFGRPLSTSIFGNSQKAQSGRKLPSKIFSN